VLLAIGPRSVIRRRPTRIRVQLAVWLIGAWLVSPLPHSHDMVVAVEMSLGDGLLARVGDGDRFNRHLPDLVTGDAPQDE
jgi:hypothetical protein